MRGGMRGQKTASARNFIAIGESYPGGGSVPAYISNESVGGLMKKTIGKLMAMCFLTMSLAAFAQSGDTMKQDTMKHDDMKNDQMKKDEMNKDKKSKKTKKDKMKKDEMKKDDSMKKGDGMKQN
jgi:pentapeptide MXKDX repeat protein